MCTRKGIIYTDPYKLLKSAFSVCFQKGGAPEDFIEIDTPKEEEGEDQSVSHEADIRRLKLAARIIQQYKDGINDLGLTDAEALQVKEWHPTFGIDVKQGDTLSKGQRILYGGDLYNVLTDHTVMSMALPTGSQASSLYAPIQP